MSILNAQTLKDDFKLVDLIHQALMTTTHETDDDKNQEAEWDYGTGTYVYKSKPATSTWQPYKDYRGTRNVRTVRQPKGKKPGRTEGRQYDPVTGKSLEKDAWYASGHACGRRGGVMSEMQKAPDSHKWLEEVWVKGYAAGRIKGISEGRVK